MADREPLQGSVALPNQVDGEVVGAASSSSTTQQSSAQSAATEAPNTRHETAQSRSHPSTSPIAAATPARGMGGFAAMVDAFMSSFRQASLAQARMQPRPQESPITAPPSQQAEPQPQTSSSGPTAPAPELAPATTSTPAATLDSSTSGDRATENRDSSSTEANEQQVEATLPQNEDSAPASVAPASERAEAGQTAPSNPENGETTRTLYFRMPFLSADGHMATLAFQPGPIPISPQQSEVRPPYGPDRPAHYGPERGNGRASGFHLPTAPIFVPLGASPLPFSFIFDTQTNTAWPIAAVSAGPPGSMPPDNETEAGFVAGPPFHVALNITFGPPPPTETPDPERAQRFVDFLEVADAELRKRMARLGLGSIGDYGGRQGLEGGDGALGCGICLDEYASEDRPEWIGGKASKDEEVVAVPCAGHHTLHRLCLYEWLAKVPPSEWTCPFCRAGLDKKKVEESSSSSTMSDTTNSARRTGDRQSQETVHTSGSSSQADTLKLAEQEAKARSLREEVRLREKIRGWRCDSAACLPRYPNQESELEFSQTTSNRMVSLLPCRHKLHFDCLCTSMRVEQADAAEDEQEEEEEEEEEEEGVEQGDDGKECQKGEAIASSDERSIEAGETSAAKEQAPRQRNNPDTVGKWVTCPTCRHEAWAELPMRKKSKKVAAARAQMTEALHRVSKTGSCPTSPNLGSKRPNEMAVHGARERAKMQDLQSRGPEDGDSDGDVEALLM